jgi:hypothetical protein
MYSQKINKPFNDAARENASNTALACEPAFGDMWETVQFVAQFPTPVKLPYSLERDDCHVGSFSTNL